MHGRKNKEMRRRVGMRQKKSDKAGRKALKIFEHIERRAGAMLTNKTL